MVTISAATATTVPFDELTEDLRRAIVRTARRLHRESPRDDVTQGQYSVLRALQAGPATPGRLAEQETVRPPAMTRTVASLDRLGLVGRSADVRDGRRVLVSLTDEGRELLAEVRRLRTEWLSTLLADTSAEEREALAAAARILHRLSDS